MGDVMTITQIKVEARRRALECLVRYNEGITTQDVIYALNSSKFTINKDIKASDVVWHQDNYLYYGERL